MYFVTICTYRRLPVLSRIVRAHVHLSWIGRIASEAWWQSASLRPDIELDAFVVMPDHIHGIIMIHGKGISIPTHRSVGDPIIEPPATLCRPPASLGAFIAGWKSTVTARVNTARNTRGCRLWQRNYHERVIRDERALFYIRRYIAENPRKWRG